MLTSSANQYLRPEYLTPLPTTLDAKKSPLALLAQTCSQIGADSPNTKLITSSEKIKSKSSLDSRDKTSPASSLSNNSISDLSIKSSFKPYDLNARDKSRSPEERAGSAVSSRVRTPMSTKSAANTPSGRCASNQSASSPRESPLMLGRKTPASNHSDSPNNVSPQQESLSIKSTESSTVTSSVATSLSSSSKSGFTSSTYTSPSETTASQLSAAYKSSLPPVSSAYLPYPSAAGLPIPMDLMTSTLMAQHHHALKTGALNSYLEYARLKNSVASPVCRDPYCTGCSLNSHFMPPTTTTTASNGKTTQPPNCPAGCVQCDHSKSSSAAQAAAAASYLGHSPAAAAAYAHAQLAALAAASQLPYVCNWIAGDANYCGKRFSSSDELLQHLRTHTSLGSLPESMLNPHNLPTHPLLHRTYPTPPLSPLATARYHPYSKPSLIPPSALTPSSLAGFSLPPHPGLPPYFSPYSLYGPRLGSASSIHP